jgi:hypothetical protein
LVLTYTKRKLNPNPKIGDTEFSNLQPTLIGGFFICVRYLYEN